MTTPHDKTKPVSTNGESRLAVADVYYNDGRRNFFFLPTAFGNDITQNPPFLTCNTKLDYEVKYNLSEETAAIFRKILLQDGFSSFVRKADGNFIYDLENGQFAVFTKEPGKPYAYEVRQISPFISRFFSNREAGEVTPLEHVCELAEKDLGLLGLQTIRKPAAPSIPGSIDPNTVGENAAPSTVKTR